MHNVLTLIARCDETHELKSLARISDEVTGEFTQVAIVEYCLTGLEAASKQSLVGNEIVFAKQKYKIIDNLDFKIECDDDLVGISDEFVQLAKDGLLNGRLDEAKSAVDFIEQLGLAYETEDECSLELHSLLLEEIK